jgi:hypothetical protein
MFITGYCPITSTVNLSDRLGFLQNPLDQARGVCVYRPPEAKGSEPVPWGGLMQTAALRCRGPLW